MAIQLIVDLYECSDMIDDMDAIKVAAHQAIDFVGAKIVEECMHKFEPIGVTYFAIISTSHFSIHTWPEYKYAAIDIFSCKDEVVDGIAQELERLFGAGRVELRTVQRDISAGVTFSVLEYDETVFQNADNALCRTKETTRMGCTVFEGMAE